MQRAVWALVPVKDFARAKTRLSLVLGAAQRAALARDLFDHVLGVLGACAELAGIVVATDSDDVAALSERRGARIVRDAGALPLGDVVDQGLDALASAGARSGLVVMADLPELSVRDVRALLVLHGAYDVVAAPDRHERQTNALVLRLPHAAKTRFGEARSFELHRVDALARGLSLAEHRSPGLELDLDEPDDLAMWRRAQHAAAPPRAMGL